VPEWGLSSVDGSNAEGRPDQDGGDAPDRPAQATAGDRSAPSQEEPESDVVLHSIGDDEEAPWCIGVSAAR
jgi:hypothetical protein